LLAEKKKISLETRGGVCVSGLIAIKKLVRASASFAPLLPFYFIISYLGGAAFIGDYDGG